MSLVSLQKISSFQVDLSWDHEVITKVDAGK